MIFTAFSRFLCSTLKPSGLYGQSIIPRFRFIKTTSRSAITNNINDGKTAASTCYNRNPRNLEYMGIQHKKMGWPFQFPRRDFWHKLILERSLRNTDAYVLHVSGKVVVSASTTENAVRKHLYSATDVSAAENIGRVLAQRMLESGIMEVMFDTLETPVVGSAVETFIKAMTDAGIEVSERDEVKREAQIGTDYDRLRIEQNNVSPKKCEENVSSNRVIASKKFKKFRSPFWVVPK